MDTTTKRDDTIKLFQTYLNRADNYELDVDGLYGPDTDTASLTEEEREFPNEVPEAPDTPETPDAPSGSFPTDGVPYDDYIGLWDSAVVRDEKMNQIDVAIDKIVANRTKYQKIEDDNGIPWWWVAAIHNLESSLSFSSHLHNGDSLTERTHNVPSGRIPAPNNPPYTWEESAADALVALKGLDKVGPKPWPIDVALYRAELYNGLGYRQYHEDVNTPYLWSYTTEYTSGKYVSDGKWDQNAVSQQIGAAALWKMMELRGLISIG